MLTGNTFLVRGDERSVPLIQQMLMDEGIGIAPADTYARVYQHFGVDEARELSARAYGKALGDGSRVFIAVFPVITNEAQNALLKTLEEPPANALFFLVHPAPDQLLPTLRSRAQTASLPYMGGKDMLINVETFLKARPRERIEMLKPLLEKNDDDRRDTGSIITFLSSLEHMLADVPHRNREGIDAVYRARVFAGDKGSLLKPLLEQVALLVPVI